MTGSGDLKFGMAEARNTPYLNNYILNDSATIWTLKKKKKKKKKKTKKVDKFPPLLPLHFPTSRETPKEHVSKENFNVYSKISVFLLENHVIVNLFHSTN